MEPRSTALRLFFATLLAYLGVGAAIPALPRFITEELGHGDLAVGVVLGAFAVTAVVFRPIGGRLSDEGSRRTIVVVGCALVAVGGALYLPPLGLGGLIAARLVLGIGEGWLYTSAASWVVDVTPEARRGEAIGLFGMSIWLGLSIGPAIGEALRVAGGYELVWGFAAIAPAVGALIAARTAERARTWEPAGRSALIAREALGPGLALGCAVFGFAALSGFVILMLEDRDVGHGAAVFTAFAIAVAATRLGLAKLPDRLGAGRTATFAAVGHAIGLGILAAAQSLPVALAGAVVMGTGYSLLFPSLALIVVQRVGDERRGVALGSFTAFFDAGMGIGAPLAGAIAATAGYTSLFWIAALLSLAAAALGARGRPAGGPD